MNEIKEPKYSILKTAWFFQNVTFCVYCIKERMRNTLSFTCKYNPAEDCSQKAQFYEYIKKGMEAAIILFAPKSALFGDSFYYSYQNLITGFL